MARKQRDYKAEERRRNELARQRGFSSRAALRRAIEKGTAAAIQPNRLRRPSTIAAQKERYKATRKTEHKGDKFPKFGFRVSDEQRAQDWSDVFSRSPGSEYNPDERPEGMSRKAYTNAYLKAWVDGDNRYVNVRHTGGSPELRNWLVNVAGFLTANIYEDKYKAG